jgi:hypothetical protein
VLKHGTYFYLGRKRRSVGQSLDCSRCWVIGMPKGKNKPPMNSLIWSHSWTANDLEKSQGRRREEGPIIDGSLFRHWMTLKQLFTTDHSDRLPQETPRQRKRKPSMSRRYQQGNVVKYGNWRIVRFRIDVPNQDRRALTYERICPVNGPGRQRSTIDGTVRPVF